MMRSNLIIIMVLCLNILDIIFCLQIDCEKFKNLNVSFSELINDKDIERISSSNYAAMDLDSYRQTILAIGAAYKCQGKNQFIEELKSIHFPFLDSYKITSVYYKNLLNSLNYIANNAFKDIDYLRILCTGYEPKQCCDAENHQSACCSGYANHAYIKSIQGISNDRFSRDLRNGNRNQLSANHNTLKSFKIPNPLPILRNVFIPRSMSTILRESSGLPINKAILNGLSASTPYIAWSTLAVITGTASVVYFTGDDACLSPQYKDQFCKTQKINSDLLNYLHLSNIQCESLFDALKSRKLEA